MYELPKEAVLKQRSEFQRVYKEGRSYASRYLVLYVLKCGAGEGKVGFAAGKKLGGAVLRNRLKRILREAYRLHRPHIRSDVSLLLVARKSLAGHKMQTARAAFLELGNKAGIFAVRQGLGE